MTKLFRAYVRLSQTSERSISNQIADCEEYVDGYDDGELDHVYNEGEYASGWDDSRDKYRQMLADAEAGEFDALVVAHGSRLGRDTLERIDRFGDLNNKWGVEFHTYDRGYVDPNLPEDVLMEVFSALSDDHGKGAEIDRLIAGIEKKIENGHYHGCPPAGLTYTKDKLALKPDPDDQEAFDQAVEAIELHDTGDYTYEEVAEEVGSNKSRVWRIINEQRDEFEAAASGD